MSRALGQAIFFFMKFETKKSLGQNFLNSDVVPRWLCDAGEIKVGEIVVEIGPGTGRLTKELLRRGARVIAIEADKRAVLLLNEEFKKEIAGEILQIHHGDVRNFHPAEFGLQNHLYKVVSNIPYYLTGMLFRLFLDSEIQPSVLVFLIQKEVAKRITSNLIRGEKESLLSLSIKVFGDVSYIREVSRGHFSPSPKIDSAIVKVSNIKRTNFSNISPKLFFETLHLGFGKKRKQLLGNLSTTYPRLELESIFEKCGFAKDIRAEDINLSEWLLLIKYLGLISNPKLDT